MSRRFPSSTEAGGDSEALAQGSYLSRLHRRSQPRKHIANELDILLATAMSAVRLSENEEGPIRRPDAGGT
jgi:hypothetical protein